MTKACAIYKFYKAVLECVCPFLPMKKQSTFFSPWAGGEESVCVHASSLDGA